MYLIDFQCLTLRQYMKILIALIRKDVLFEWRSLYQISGLMAFLLGVAYLIYFFVGSPILETWNLLFWLVLLFLSFFIGSRLFEEDAIRYKSYLHQMVSPVQLFLAKVIFSFFLLTVLSVLLFSIFLILIPVTIHSWFNWMVLFIILNFGLAVIMTFGAFLAALGQNRTILLTILTLPLSFPSFGLSYSIGLKFLDGNSIKDCISNFQPMLAIDLISLALVIILLPYTWKN